MMTENFPNLMREKVTQIQEAQRIPIKMNPNRPTPKTHYNQGGKLQDKERILKTAREKQLVTYKGALIKLSADFSTETLQARRDWHKIFQVIKGKYLQPRLLCPARLSF